MKFRFLSAKKDTQRTARNFGILLLFIGTAFLRHRVRGSDDIVLCGLLMLIWSAMSWFIHRAKSEISVWGHIGAVVVVILCFFLCACFITFIFIPLVN